MNPSAPPSGPAAIVQMLNAAQATAVLSSAISLGVFPKISAGAHTAETIAKGIQCPERSTRILLDAMVVIGLLNKTGSNYDLTPLADEHLVPGKPMYAGDTAGILASPMIWEGLANLAEAVKQGGSVLPEHAETPRHPFWEVFAQASASMAFGASQGIEQIIGGWIREKKSVRVLDIAAGSGIYGFNLVQNHLNVELVSLDWPNVIKQTREWATKLKVDTKRVKYIEGNLFDVDYGGPYDLILLSHVYHHFEPQVCASLTKKVAQALAPGGRAVVHDFLTDSGNPAGVMFSLTMLTWTRKGEAYSADNYRTWLTGAGLRTPSVQPIPGMPTSVVMAEK